MDPIAGMPEVEETTQDNHNNDMEMNYNGPLVVVTLLFFMWGFITCMNDILIPKLQEVFTLQHWQAMLIQTAFFGAYFFISLLYFLFSISKGDPIRKIGYKNGIIIGLIVAAVGCVFFYPAADFQSYGFFLMALFVLASGITILQIAANPYVAILGPPETASSRLNLTQALNSFGTTIAPIVGGYLIFDQVQSIQASNADSVKLPYLGLAALLLLIAVLIKASRLPKVSGEEEITADAGALKYPHLVLGIVCIFMYVGGEVSIGSALINFFKLSHIAGMEQAEGKHYLAFYLGGAMIGRFFGAVALGQFRKDLYKYLIIALISAITFISVYSIYSLDLALIAMWSVIAIGLFNSIMFPTIFTLAIKGLGVHTS